MMRCRIPLSVLAFILASLLLLFLNHWTGELWEEKAVAASNLFQPPPSPNEITNATINQRITKIKKAISCSSATMCSAQSELQSPVPGAEAASCPFYFNWIHNDLKPWQNSGITVDMVEVARASAAFRLMVVEGRLFIEFYRRSFQTRALFTIWGFAQLLKFYPGMVPDVDLMFDTDDIPLIRRFRPENQTSTAPPPLIRYCGSQDTYDIAFPDWSFWGWPEIQIPPWEKLVQEILNGSREVKWEERDPTAYWKGNPLSRRRRQLLKCSKRPHWNGRLYTQDWAKESKEGFRDSKISNQCKNRYKIYIEGRAWSVSLKYILACDSPSLLVKPKFHDFFSRGLVPQRHYWPVRDDKICESIESAVDWGNNHTKEAMEIGKAGRDFIVNELKMSNVYDYMLHFLEEYAKLLKYKPSVTRNAAEYCSETITCSAKEAEKEYLKDSMVKSASPSLPCRLN